MKSFSLVSCIIGATSFFTSAYGLTPTKPHSLNSWNIHRRDPTGNFNTLYLASNYQNGSTAPGATSQDASGQTVVVGGTGADDDSQRPGCNTIFINTAAVGGSQTTGWTSTPQLVGFNIDRNVTYGSDTMPVYIESGKDYSTVKRVLLTQPGNPRDTWKYVNLFRNSLLCAVGNSSMAVTFDDVLVAAPIWLGASDVAAGAGQSSDVYFGDSSWATGSNSQGPGNLKISTFQAMDDIISRFADQSIFPALTSIYVVGHSLGGSFSQRYAFARNYNASTDPLVKYWVGNPGAYVWPSANRPVTPSNTSCASVVNDWAYGVAGDLPSYFGSIGSNVAAIYDRYFARTIQYALGLADNGPGDTHCEAQYQGSSHLSRGQNMQQALQASPGGLPASQSFNYVPNTSHEDYLMMADPNSQEYLFVTNLDSARPAGTTSNSASTSSNSGSTSTTTTKGKKSSTSSTSSATGGSAASSGSVALSSYVTFYTWAFVMTVSFLATLLFA